MWEWRVFWVALVTGPDIFELLKVKAPNFEAARTDVYIVVTKDVGIKWRDDTNLEYKVRDAVNASVGCELWDKVSEPHTESAL